MPLGAKRVFLRACALLALLLGSVHGAYKSPLMRNDENHLYAPYTPEDFCMGAFHKIANNFSEVTLFRFAETHALFLFAIHDRLTKGKNLSNKERLALIQAKKIIHKAMKPFLVAAPISRTMTIDFWERFNDEKQQYQLRRQ